MTEERPTTIENKRVGDAAIHVNTPQSGIFALGTASHAYLEFDAAAGRTARELVTAVSSLREPRTTMGGVNLVAGFRPELWRDAVPQEAPPDLEGFNEPVGGGEGFEMPATQHDAVPWLSGAAYWESLAIEAQEKVIGRTKAASVELDDKPPDSHVASTDQDRFGKIFRRNMPYGTVTEHGTMFVGFCSRQRPPQRCWTAWRVRVARREMR